MRCKGFSSQSTECVRLKAALCWSLVGIRGTPVDKSSSLWLRRSKVVKENSLLFVSGQSFLSLVKYNITSSHTEALECLPGQHYTTT